MDRSNCPTRSAVNDGMVSRYGKANSYEVSSINGKVDGLEREVRELSSTCDGLRSELSQLQENFRQALEILGQVTTVL